MKIIFKEIGIVGVIVRHPYVSRMRTDYYRTDIFSRTIHFREMVLKVSIRYKALHIYGNGVCGLARKHIPDVRPRICKIKFYVLGAAASPAYRNRQVQMRAKVRSLFLTMR